MFQILSHGRVKKPSDLSNNWSKIKSVKITKIDPEEFNRVSASVKALTEDPYSNHRNKI